jgi:uncharacterized protein involved in exopolysaccharide biosynthesis
MLDEQTTPTGGNTSSVEAVLQTLLRRKSTVIVVMAVVTAAALGFSLAQAPIYEASVKILVGQERVQGIQAPLGTSQVFSSLR